jgi:hypothetical protein
LSETYLTRNAGKPFQIEKQELEDLKAGIVKTSSIPTLDRPDAANLLPSNGEDLARQVLACLLLNAAEGTGSGSDEWNQIFPDYQFTKVEEYLTGVFADDA